MNIKYVNMCAMAIDEIQKIKHTGKMNEGDRIYDGEKIRVVGHDFIGLNNLYMKTGCPAYEVAIEQSKEIDYQIRKGSEGKNSIYKGLYEIVTLVNFVWLPTTSDLISMMMKKFELESYVEFICKVEEILSSQPIYYDVSDSSEELFLKFYMETLHNKFWTKYGNWVEVIKGV